MKKTLFIITITNNAAAQYNYRTKYITDNSDLMHNTVKSAVQRKLHFQVSSQEYTDLNKELYDIAHCTLEYDNIEMRFDIDSYLAVIECSELDAYMI